MRAHVPELVNTPLCEQESHLFQRQALSEPGRVFVGERLGDAFPARERVERREEHCLWVGDDPRDGRDPEADAPIRTDKPVPRLTTEGPFRYTRNPGYLCLAMIYAEIAVLRNALWAILPLSGVLYVIEREVIGREERYLESTFGGEYLDYKARVRR